MNTYLLKSETIFKVRRLSVENGAFDEYVEMMEKEGVLSKYFDVKTFERMISEVKTEFDNLPKIWDYSNFKHEIAMRMATHMVDTLVRHRDKRTIEEMVQTCSEETHNDKKKCICYFGRALRECTKLAEVSIREMFKASIFQKNQMLSELSDSGKFEESSKRKIEIESIMIYVMSRVEDLCMPSDQLYLNLRPGNLKQMVVSTASELSMDKEFGFIPVEIYMDEVLDMPYYEKLLREQREDPEIYGTDLKEVHEIKAMADQLFKERMVINVLEDMMNSNLKGKYEFNVAIRKLLQENRTMLCMDYYDTLLNTEDALTDALLEKYRKILDEEGIPYIMGTSVGNTVYVDGDEYFTN